MFGIKSLRRLVFAPKSRFKKGEAVQLTGGDGQLMCVIEICTERGMKAPLIHCQFSIHTGTAKRLFPECELEPFDWYHAALRPVDTKEESI